MGNHLNYKAREVKETRTDSNSVKVNKRSSKIEIKYIVAEEMIDKHGNHVLVKPGTDEVLSVFTKSLSENNEDI